MKRIKYFAALAAFLCTTTTGWAQNWLGSGNSTDPYLLNSSNEWEALAKQVAEGEYTIDAKGQMAYTWLDQDGKQLNPGITEKTPEMEAVFYADGIGQYLGAITANCYVARAFGKDYSVTETDISWGGNAGDDNTQGTGISNEGATGDNR